MWVRHEALLFRMEVRDCEEAIALNLHVRGPDS